jgi:chemotaxis protein MotB
MKKSSEWMSISDMMSGLMLIFLFVAVAFMLNVEDDKTKLKKAKEKITQIALTYQKSKIELNKDLHNEFDKDLTKWNAEITKDNSIVFNSPEVLFDTGKSEIKNRFKEILNEFFPRFVKILISPKYKNEIDEIRIEGHTSNVWLSAQNKKEVYLNNMRLSQDRANSVLNYVYLIDNPIITSNRNFLEKNLRANGMAYSKLKYLDNNKTKIDYIHSRRVEFKIKLKTEEKIFKILKVAE